MFRERVSMEEIATKRDMSLIAVGNAIQRVEQHRMLNSDDMVRTAFNETVLGSVKKMGEVLVGAMGAKIETFEKTGKVGKERWKKSSRPDHATRLKAVETAKGIFESTQPKGGGIQVNTQVNNGMGPSGEPRARGNSFEERLRTIREAKGLKDEAEVIIDAEEIEGSTLQDEMDDIGIDLSDDDEDDELDEDEDDAEGSA